jgi:hypothetical protein
MSTNSNLSLKFLLSPCSWIIDGAWKAWIPPYLGYILDLIPFIRYCLLYQGHLCGPLVHTSLHTPIPIWRHPISYRSFFCSQTSRFKNYTHVRHFIHLLVCILIFFHIIIHVLLHGFLIHLPLQTLNHHPVHFLVLILNSLGFLLYLFIYIFTTFTI